MEQNLKGIWGRSFFPSFRDWGTLLDYSALLLGEIVSLFFYLIVHFVQKEILNY